MQRRVSDYPYTSIPHPTASKKYPYSFQKTPIDLLFLHVMSASIIKNGGTGMKFQYTKALKSTPSTEYSKESMNRDRGEEQRDRGVKVESVTIMNVARGGITGTTYTVELTFSETPNHIGEEIRAELKRKYIAEKIGAMQSKTEALQSPTKEKKEG